MKLSEIAVDVAKEEAGDWVDIPDLPGVSVKVRSIHNADYRRLSAKLLGKLRRRLGGRELMASGIPVEEADRITARCLLETVLLDWKGITDDNGKALPFGRDTAKSLLFDRQYRVFQDAVAWAAALVGQRDLEAEEEAVKNS